MPKVSLYNQDGQQVGEIALADAVFGVPADASFVHEISLAARANARRSIANTKTRGEVSGGGKKPWKQKGTGRARAGSSRSPIWVGGGITFGPRSERNYHQKVNKKAKQKALFMALSDKLTNSKLVILDGMKTDPAKTKFVVQTLKKLPLDKTVLLVAPAPNPTLMRMVRNLPNVTMVTAQSVNLLDVLKNRSLLFLKDAVPAFEKLYV